MPANDQNFSILSHLYRANFIIEWNNMGFKDTYSTPFVYFQLTLKHITNLKNIFFLLEMTKTLHPSAHCVKF